MGTFKKNGKVGIDVPKGGNGMREAPQVGLVSVWRGHTESHLFVSSLHSLIHLFIHPFIQHIFLEHLLFARHCAKPWGSRDQPSVDTALRLSLVGKTDETR